MLRKRVPKQRILLSKGERERLVKLGKAIAARADTEFGRGNILGGSRLSIPPTGYSLCPHNVRCRCMFARALLFAPYGGGCLAPYAFGYAINSPPTYNGHQ